MQPYLAMVFELPEGRVDREHLSRELVSFLFGREPLVALLFMIFAPPLLTSCVLTGAVSSRSLVRLEEKLRTSGSGTAQEQSRVVFLATQFARHEIFFF